MTRAWENLMTIIEMSEYHPERNSKGARNPVTLDEMLGIRSLKTWGEEWSTIRSMRISLSWGGRHMIDIRSIKKPPSLRTPSSFDLDLDHVHIPPSFFPDSMLAKASEIRQLISYTTAGTRWEAHPFSLRVVDRVL